MIVASIIVTLSYIGYCTYQMSRPDNWEDYSLEGRKRYSEWERDSLLGDAIIFLNLLSIIFSNPVPLKIRISATSNIVVLLLWLRKITMGSSNDFYFRQASRARSRNRLSPKIPDGCSGCKYLHGKRHGENLLVCGIHPYGQEDCTDFEYRQAKRKWLNFLEKLSSSRRNNCE